MSQSMERDPRRRFLNLKLGVEHYIIMLCLNIFEVIIVFENRF